MAKFFSFFSKDGQGLSDKKVSEEQKPEPIADAVSGKEEPVTHHGASSRMVETSIGWFARTREKDDLGPYPTEQDAMDALAAYLNFTRPSEGRPYYPHVVHGMVIHDPDTCPKDLCAFCIEAESSQQDTWNDLVES